MGNDGNIGTLYVYVIFELQHTVTWTFEFPEIIRALEKNKTNLFAYLLTIHLFVY